MKKKVAIVTGGTRGIGREVTLSLAKEGMKVIALFARNSMAAESLLELTNRGQLEIKAFRGDLTRDDDYGRIIDKIKAETSSIDIIVHSAANGVHRDIAQLTAKHMRWTYEINVISIQKLLSDVVPMMNENGRVVGITSSGGVRVIPYYGAVGSSKGALESLFRHYAHELASRKISVNLVSPGLVLTDAINAFPDRELKIEACIKGTPSLRLTTSEDVAELVKFLCVSNCAGQIVGQTLVIDGGKTLLS